MQFTPQQLTGGPRYQHNVRIGNWSEDMELEGIQRKDYLAKKEGGNLVVVKNQNLLEESLQRANLSSTEEDGLLRFGDKIMLFSHQTKGYMCVNPFDKVVKTNDAFVLTTGPNSTACVRNVFTIERYDQDDDYDDEVVHYGQKFYMRLMAFSKIKEDAYMHSELVTALAASKFTRHQEVTALCARSNETLWQMLYPDNKRRFQTDGEPIPAGRPVVFRHIQSGSFLSSSEVPYHNIFGQEYETHCYPYYSLNKTHNCVGEKKGDITGDYALRRHGLPNIWTVVTATNGPSAEALDVTQEPAL